MPPPPPRRFAKLRFTAFPALVLLGFVATFALLKISDKTPSLIVSPGSVNLGVVEEGIEPESWIRLANPSSSTIFLDKVGTSCGCTNVSVPHEIPPHCTVKLHVSYLSKNRVGAVKQTISLNLRDVKKTIIIPVDGTVVRRVSVEPQSVTVPGEFTVSSSDGANLSIREMHCPRQLRLTRVSQTPLSAKYKVDVVDRSLAGANQDNIVFGISNPRVPAISVPVFWQNKSAYSVSPAAVNFGSVALHSVAKQKILLRGVDLSHLRVTSYPPTVKVELASTQSHQEAILMVEWQARNGEVPLLNSRLVLSTGNASEPRIIIPLYAVIRYGDGCTADVPCRK